MSKKAVTALVIMILMMTFWFTWTEVLAPRFARSPLTEDDPNVASPFPISADYSIAYSEPLPDRRGNLLPAELAWIMRERLTLDVLRELTSSRSMHERVNARVANFNRITRELASSRGFLERDHQAAKKRVEDDREMIVRNALNEALSGEVPIILRAQLLLRQENAYLGIISGREDDEMVYAVKTYQLRHGLDVTGKTDESLLTALVEGYVRKKSGLPIEGLL